MKKVYVIRGSEDGAFAVYSNMKSAIERAIIYVECSGECNQSYEELYKNLRTKGWCIADTDSCNVVCDVDAFDVEK